MSAIKDEDVRAVAVGKLRKIWKLMTSARLDPSPSSGRKKIFLAEDQILELIRALEVEA